MARTTRRSSSKPAPTNAEVYERVTARIVEAMERGEDAPWQKPWRTSGMGMPTSMSSGKAYRGINWLVLAVTAMDKAYTCGWWGTYRQIQELGGQVRAGETGTTVMLFKDRQVSKEVDGEQVTQRIPLARAFTVFNAEQADCLPGKFHPEPQADAEPERLAEPEEILGAYFACGPKLRYIMGDRAYYNPAADEITLPDRQQFRSPEAFYSTAFHEAAHSTGHPSRLDREGIAGIDHFGSGRYAREELVAQIGSAMLCAASGIDSPTTQANDVAYLQSWAEVLKGDPKMIVSAASQAQKAADLVCEPTRELQKSAEGDDQAEADMEAA